MFDQTRQVILLYVFFYAYIAFTFTCVTILSGFWCFLTAFPVAPCIKKIAFCTDKDI